jgi:hypothetical protein|tara:strand:+ start:444 stop:701 length:258 start_codon:yes stop_codon:yes gene_type:complete
MSKVDEILFSRIKSIISDCVCKTLNFHNAKTTEIVLNKLANEYTDKVITQAKKELRELIMAECVPEPRWCDCHSDIKEKVLELFK